MTRIECSAVALVFSIGLWAAEPDRPELIRPSFRNLTPEARSLLADCKRAAVAWRPHVDRPRVFVRSQLVYGNQLTNYLHSWYERPLHQDSSLGPCEKGHAISAKSWLLTARAARDTGLDGFVFFPNNPGCMDILPRSVMPGGEMTIFPQFTPHSFRDLGKCLELCGLFLQTPNVFRLNGKVVLIGYDWIFADDERTENLWRSFRKALIERYGADRFVIMPEFRIFDLPDLDRSETDAKTLEKTRGRLRRILREWDGLFYCLRDCDWAPPEYLRQPHDEIVAPLVLSVLSEPEFRRKYLGIEFYQGHENVYMNVAMRFSHGMTRLRTALESIDRIRPDFIVGSEWDEENENVHFRPTVSNGQTTQRLMRFFADRWKGRDPAPYAPTDDVAIPNLVLSCRKSVQLGEILQAQVTAIPDGTSSGPIELTFRWKRQDGTSAKDFPSQILDSGTCAQADFSCSSLDVARETLLWPELTVESPRGSQVFADGFWPLDVQASRMLDGKWVRHALREVSRGVKGALESVRRNADGTIEVAAHVTGPKRFRSVEVLEGSDTVYAYEPGVLPPSADRVDIKVKFDMPSCFWKVVSPTGSVRILNAPHAVLATPNAQASRRADGTGWNFTGRRSQFSRFFTVAVPREDSASAILELDFPDVLGRRFISMADLTKNGNYSFALPYGGQIAVLRRLTTAYSPAPVWTNSATFAFTMKPLDPNAVLRVQTVDEDYGVWRGPAICLFEPSRRDCRFHVYDEWSDCSKDVSLDERRLYRVRYDFARTRGDLAYDLGGRGDSPCVFGGSLAIVTGVGQGGCGYQHALHLVRPKYDSLNGGHQTTPVVVLEPEGFSSLAFSNCAFATLPMQFVPRYTGFRLRFRIRLDDSEGRQCVFDSRNLGFQMSVDEGVPTAFLSFGNWMERRGVNASDGLTVRGIRLAPGEWHSLVVCFDQHAAWIETDGIPGVKAYGSGYELSPFVTAFGCTTSAGRRFRGRIADLSIEPY